MREPEQASCITEVAVQLATKMPLQRSFDFALCAKHISGTCPSSIALGKAAYPSIAEAVFLAFVAVMIKTCQTALRWTRDVLMNAQSGLPCPVKLLSTAPDAFSRRSQSTAVCANHLDSVEALHASWLRRGVCQSPSLLDHRSRFDTNGT